MFCCYCGKILNDDAKFCAYCGKVLPPAPKAPIQKMPSSHQTSPSPIQPKVLSVVNEKRTFTFIKDYWGLVTLGTIFLASLLITALVSPGYAIHMFRNVYIFEYLPFLFAILISWRAKGVDLSGWGLANLPGMFIVVTGSFWMGMILGALVACIFGLINGLFIRYLRLPSTIVTLVTGIFAAAICTWAAPDLNLEPIHEFDYRSNKIILLIILLICTILIYKLINNTLLMKEIDLRSEADNRNPIIFWAYPISALLSSIAAFIRIMGQMPPHYGFTTLLPIILLTLTFLFSCKSLECRKWIVFVTIAICIIKNCTYIWAGNFAEAVQVLFALIILFTPMLSSRRETFGYIDNIPGIDSIGLSMAIRDENK